MQGLGRSPERCASRSAQREKEMRHAKTLVAFVAIGLLGFLGINAARDHQREFMAIQAQRAAGALLLDVRTPQEHRDDHIKGAVNIPLQQLEQRLNELSDKREVDIIIYCRSGSRSRQATALLRRAGFSRVKDAGAMSNLRR